MLLWSVQGVACGCTDLLSQIWCKVSLAKIFDGTIHPRLILKGDHLVAEDTLALMNPQTKQVTLWRGDRCTKGWQLSQGGILHESVTRCQDDTLEHLLMTKHGR